MSATTSPPTARLLLVEDDERIRQALGLALQDMGYAVAAVPTGEEALAGLDRHRPDVVLLDLTLPGMDGLAVCRELRAGGDLPIIIVSARSDTADVIEGLECGADDYVVKPLVASELAARIKALLRRRRPVGSTQGAGQRDVLTLGPVSVELANGLVVRPAGPTHLTRTEARLLAELAAAGGTVVTREELLQRVWGYDYFGDTRLLDVHVRRLRRKVEADPDRPEWLMTVRGVGYRLALS
jgi:DNA-binding response OmpR family regulator